MELVIGLKKNWNSNTRSTNLISQRKGRVESLREADLEFISDRKYKRAAYASWGG